MREKFRGRRPDQRPPRRLAPAGRAHPARLDQPVEREAGQRNAADRLDLGARDRLVIGDDRQRLDRGAGQSARDNALALQFRREVGRGAEGPAAGDAHEVDAAPVIRVSASSRTSGAISASGPRCRASSSSASGSGAAKSRASSSRSRCRRSLTLTGDLAQPGTQRSRRTAAAQMYRAERTLLAQFEAAGAHQFEHRREGRGQSRTAEHAAAELVGKKRGQLAPFRHMADQASETPQRLVQRIQRGRRDDQHLAVAPAMAVAIGAQKLVQAQP